MFARVRLRLGAALAVAALTAGSAGAATVVDLSIQNFDRTLLQQAQTQLFDFASGQQVLPGQQVLNFKVETFEGYDAWNGSSGDSNPQDTAVGRFTGIGDDGSGAALISDGTRAQVRSDITMPFGRYNSTNSDLLPDGLVSGNWLDSNDMTGMEWKIEGAGMFNALAFFLIDAADVGARFSMNIGDSSFVDLAGGARLANGSVYLVIAQLSETVDSLTVEFLNNRTNDGFGIDGAMIANIAPIPLPPAAALLLAGIAAFAAVRRRRLA